jgi:L-fuconolactonase
MSVRVDAHQHLWHYDAEEFSWIDEEHRDIRRDFLTRDLQAAMSSARVNGSVATQARQSIEETEWLIDVARTFPGIYGVVGWLPLLSDALDEHLEHFSAEPLLKGLRHVVQSEPDGFLERTDFNAGIERLRGTDLTYDLLIVERQLPEAVRFVDRHPQQMFVLDHIAKPRIATGEIEPWRKHLRALAERPNVICKLSGMTTEAGVRQWTSDQLKPYVDVVLDAFGAERIMIGSDWPVLLAGCQYAQWWGIVEGWVAELSSGERASILGQTAQRIYHLQTSAPERNLNKEGGLA